MSESRGAFLDSFCILLFFEYKIPLKIVFGNDRIRLYLNKYNS